MHVAAGRGPQVVTVGHAIVDVLAATPDRAVAELGLDKGTMTLVDEDRSEQIYRLLHETAEASGGSAANTAHGLAAFGAQVRFIGKVRDDHLGQVFRDAIRAAGVGFDVPPGVDGPGTGRCCIMVTPDAERTMCTYLGIGDDLTVDDVDTGAIAAAEVVYIEGYLCGLDSTEAAVAQAVAAARDSGTQVALSLSDPFWVELHGEALAALLDRVDLLFGNEQEACGLAGTDDVDSAVSALAERCATVVVTRGSAPVVVANGGRVIQVAAQPVSDLVDTTGAGDLFAAGYLYGVVSGFAPDRCARLGNLAAADVITHMGARPAGSLTDLVDET